jgi:transposase
MWTKENRGRYDRSRLRYPSDLTDEEWALVEPLIAPAKRGGNKRTVDVREVGIQQFGVPHLLAGAL